MVAAIDINQLIIWDKFNPDNPEYEKMVLICTDFIHELYTGNGTGKTTLFKAETVNWFKKNDKNIAKKLTHLEDWRYSTIGFYYWLKNHDAILVERTNNWLDEKINLLLITAEEKIIEKKKNVIIKKAPISLDTMGVWLAQDMEELILTDELTKNPDSVYKLLNSHNPKPASVRSCIQQLEVYINELRTLTKNEIIEGYGNEDKRNIAISEYFELIRVVKTYSQNTKTKRKARKQRKKTNRASKAVQDMSYKKEDADLKLVSVDPSQLVGAKSALIYNTKTRRIGIFYAKDSSGLAVRGTTIHNLDEEKSTNKTLRKPKEQIELFRSGTQKRCEIVLRDYIKAVSKPMTGRLNEHTVIMKVWKK